MKKIAFTLAMLLALSPMAAARNGGDRVRHLDFTEDTSITVNLTGSVTDEGTGAFEWNEYDGDDFRAYVLAVVKSDDDHHYDDSRNRNRNRSNSDDDSNDDSQSNSGNLLASVATDYSLLASSDDDDDDDDDRSGSDDDDDDDDSDDDRSGSDDDDDDDDSDDDRSGSDDDDDDDDSDDDRSGSDYDDDDDDSDDDRFRSRRAVIATIDDQSVVSFETRIPAGNREYVLCVVTTSNTAACSASIELMREPSQDEVAIQQRMIRFENFRDTAGHWSEDHIRRLVKAGVIDADKDDFRPNDEITRAEAIKMIIVGAGLEAYQCDEDVFPDVKADDWFCAVATAAFDEGIAEGENGYLNPNARLNRAQAVKLVLVAKGISVENVDDTNTEFPDVKAGAWFSKFAKKAKELGIISGKDKGGQKIFDPSAPITRAELAKIIDVAFN